MNQQLRRRSAGALLCVSAALLIVAGCAGPGAGPEESVSRPLTKEEQELRAHAEIGLHSPDSAVRLRSAVVLLSMRHADTLEDVLDTIKNADLAAERISAIQAAAFCQDRRCFRTVLSAINDADPHVQQEAAASLARFTRRPEVEAMIELVQGEEVTARQRRLLFEAFGAGLAVKAVPVLLEGLASGEEETRKAAVRALEDISGRKFGADPQRWARWWEINSSRSREDIIEERLQALNDALRAKSRELNDLVEQQQELMQLVKLPAKGSLKPLLKGLDSRHEAVREYASFRLAALDGEGLQGVALEPGEHAALRRVLQGDAVQVTRDVIRFVARLQGEGRDELIRLALDVEDPEVLVTAIGAVTADGAAAGRLAELLARSSAPEVREAAANTLGRVGSTETVPTLVAALDDEAENVRWFAVEGLRKLAATDRVLRISELLETDPSARVREIAASTLGALGQPAGTVALRKALSDENERVRQKAEAALLELATDSYERMSGIADAFVEAGLLDSAAKVLGHIIEQYGDDEEMRDRMANAYGRLADVLQQQEGYAAAARAYEKLDALAPGQQEVRRGLVTNLARAGEAARVVASFQKWLAPPAADPAVVTLALDLAELLARAEKTAEAREILVLAAAAAGGADEAVKKRIAGLRAEIGE